MRLKTSRSTHNHYLTAIKGFTGWLVKDRRTGDNPLTHLSRLNASTDVRRERHILPPAEFGRLIDAATQGVTVCGLSGSDRAMLYVTAAYTGLRAAELASLVEVSLDFDGNPLTVTIEAAYSKHRRKDVLPLHPDLARRLQKWLSERSQDRDDENPVLPLRGLSDAKLWQGKWAEQRHAAKMLRHDLKVAGVPYADEAGKVFDFHALRHQFISMLARAGVHPKSWLATLLSR